MAIILVSVYVVNVSATSMNDVMKAHNITRTQTPPELNSPTMVKTQILMIHGCLHNTSELSGQGL